MGWPFLEVRIVHMECRVPVAIPTRSDPLIVLMRWGSRARAPSDSLVLRTSGSGDIVVVVK